jgi:hypothetical protein
MIVYVLGTSYKVKTDALFGARVCSPIYDLVSELYTD